MGHFLHSKEGATQGDPIAMITYGMGTPPLIRDLQTAYPGINQPWYADDSEAGGTFDVIRRHLDDLMVRRPLRGYFLEPTKIILVVSPRNVPRVEAFFRG